MEANTSDLSLKLIRWATAVESIMRATIIATAPCSSRAFIADVGKATQRAVKSRAAVFLRVAKAPTVSALARGRDIKPDGAQDTPNVDMSGRIVALKSDPSNVGGGFLATPGRQGVAANADSVILAK